MRNLNVRAQTADADILPDLETLRARSRHLIMNAPLAGGHQHTVLNVVGTGCACPPGRRHDPCGSCGATPRRSRRSRGRRARMAHVLPPRACGHHWPPHLRGHAEPGLPLHAGLATFCGRCPGPARASVRLRPAWLIEADRLGIPTSSRTSKAGRRRRIRYRRGWRLLPYRRAGPHPSVKRNWRRFPAWAADGSLACCT